LLESSVRKTLLIGVAILTLALPAHGQAPSPSPSPCVALTMPSLRGMEGNTTELATALRDLVASFLSGPSLRTIALDARLPAQAFQEARQGDCRLILTTTLTRRRSSGGLGRALGQAAGAAAWHMPYSSAAGHVAARAGAAAASTIATNTREKDAIRLEFRLSANDGTSIREGHEEAKARIDGEDLITPLVERIATIVATAAAK
jgi:hypothetical protein